MSPLRTTTQGEDVYNLTGQPITLIGYGSSERPEGGGPAIGTVVPVGGVLHFEVIYNFLRRTVVKPEFATQPVGPNTTVYKAELITTEFNEAAVKCTTSGGSGQCAAGGTKYILGRAVSLLDAPGTKIEISSTDSDAQSRVLNNLCNEQSQASCSFAPTSEDRYAYTPIHTVGSVIRNSTSNELTRAVSISDTQSQTDSVTVTAKISRLFLDKIVNFEISAAYGHTWTNTHTFTETITVKVPPGYQSQILAEQPVYRVVGDFQLLLPGDTAFVLRDTYFDTPDRNRDGIYTVTERPIDPTGQGGEVLTPVGPSTTVP